MQHGGESERTCLAPFLRSEAEREVLHTPYMVIRVVAPGEADPVLVPELIGLA